MHSFDTYKQHVGQTALELEQTILAKAQEMRNAALHGETNDNPRMLAIANYLEASVRDPDGEVSRWA